MVAPTLEQTRAAAAGIHTMPEPEFKQRKTKEAGDALTAFFVILVRKLFPSDMEHDIAPKVELMLAAYFLRGNLDARGVKAPDEARAKKVIDGLAGLDGKALGQRMTDEVGSSVLAFFDVFAKKVAPQHATDAQAKLVQLMVLAYLARHDLSA